MTKVASGRRGWRSLLFVPGSQPRMLASAARRGADAVVVDLEDSVTESEKDAAREGFAAALSWDGTKRCDLLVRINNVPKRRDADIRAAIQAGATGIVVPKAEAAAQLSDIAAAVRVSEQEFGRPPGSTCLVPLVETPGGLFHLREIASVLSVAAIALGDEDLALALGCRADSPTLVTFKHKLVVAAAEAGCQSLGLGVSIAQFGDLSAFRNGAEAARSWGMGGSFCIHPAQVAVLNEVFSPSDDEVEHALGVIRAYEASVSAGSGATAYGGAMIDRPIVERAYRTLEAAEVLKGRAL